jgi:hypothetical protein
MSERERPVWDRKLVWRRVVSGTYTAKMATTKVQCKVVHIRGAGWFLVFTDGNRFIARTRTDARLACEAYLKTGSMPEGLSNVTK